ncbi:MAG: DNA repair protein RecN [Clostridia bacterium]|nr:DNA repair protein RecN [Clostridia bacterium]
MISHISIKNFAIIENAEIDFEEGLNIITGETGSGKSVAIEAVSLALGSRADTAFVRHGCEKAVVQLAASVGRDEYVITREVSKAGKNLCKVNGELVSLSQLSNLCKKIADIHGQYDHQSLLNPDYHINLVDLYHADAISPKASAVAVKYDNYRKIKAELAALAKDESESRRTIDFLQFELNEIQKASLKHGEDEELQERISLLKNSERIYTALSEAYEKTYGASPSALEELSGAANALSSVEEISESLKALSSEFSDLYYSLQDLSERIRTSRDNISFSESELDECIMRLDLIEALKRKHGGSIDSVLDYASEAEKRINNATNSAERKNELEKLLAKAVEDLRTACDELTSERKKAAEDLSGKIMEQLGELNFANTRLSIEFSKLPEEFSASGQDKIEFMISTNPGEPLKPLAKIASGGEMSRIMLAFKAIIADYDNIPTMIFDEIDSGISGIAASVVGKKMRKIAQKHQIICITHLPQIAACGTSNYRITKETAADSTSTSILRLDEKEKTDEIARLLGGSNITETTLKSARELIAASV